jgi:hypothetical protein
MFDLDTRTGNQEDIEMSIQSAAQFFDKAMADDGLRNKIIAAAAGATDGEKKAEAVAKLGKSAGFDFTPAEAIEIRAATRKAMIDQGAVSDELDDLDLKAVTGGLSFNEFSAGAEGEAEKLSGQMGGPARVPGLGIATSFFSAGVVGGIKSAVAGGGVNGFFNGFANGVVGEANTIKQVFTNPAGAAKSFVSNVESFFSGW